MFESSLLLIDKLISLLRVREEHKKNLFKDFVEPLFGEVEKAYQDQYQFLCHLKRAASSTDKRYFTEEVIHQIQAERDQSRTLRLKIRALSSEYRIHFKPKDDIDTFFGLTETLLLRQVTSRCGKSFKTQNILTF